MFRMGAHALHRRRGSAGTVVVVILVLALIAGGLWYFLLRSTPERAVSAFLEAARAGDDALMQEHLTERSGDEDSPTVGVAKHLAGEPEGEAKYTIGDAVIAESVATVPVEFPLGETAKLLAGKETFTVPFVVHREGQTWLVDAPDTWEKTLKSGLGALIQYFTRFMLPGGATGAPPTQL